MPGQILSAVVDSEDSAFEIPVVGTTLDIVIAAGGTGVVTLRESGYITVMLVLFITVGGGGAGGNAITQPSRHYGGSVWRQWWRFVASVKQQWWSAV